ncbi:MAG: beta-ketoacyl-[acyl-carrier-protein] synthase family protein, partial [Clostridiales bacterium]|nr:beta-ketoacyl-[acyl-carrier-protein] synthase family protein [Clostridiales bacterium]
MKMTTDDKRCVITGLGMICAIGNSVDECWKSAMEGKSGIAHTKTVGTEGCYTDYAAEVKCDTLDTKETAGMDRASKLCIKAADEAIKDAGLKNFGGDHRTGVVMGSCVGGVVSIENYYTKKKTPEYIAQMPISAIASQVASHVGAGGACTNIANACAAGAISIAHAVDLIRDGKADIVVAGGTDAFASVPYAGFISLHALAEQPCSPLNHSNGLTLGEGSGVVIVESYEHAKARGAKIYCEVLGSGVSSDAHHITAPRPDGEGQMNAIRRAIKNSGITEADIGYINAHGTGTAKNDEAEFLSLHTIFDGKNNDLSVSSTKAMTGHCLGAAGAIEAVFSIKALTENEVPP